MTWHTRSQHLHHNEHLQLRQASSLANIGIDLQIVFTIASAQQGGVATVIKSNAFVVPFSSTNCFALGGCISSWTCLRSLGGQTRLLLLFHQLNNLFCFRGSISSWTCLRSWDTHVCFCCSFSSTICFALGAPSAHGLISDHGAHTFACVVPFSSTICFALRAPSAHGLL